MRTLLSAHGGFVPLRIDRAMADRAVTLGPRVLVLAALDSTLAPTRQLLDSSCARANVSIEARYLVVAGAWAHFLADDYPAYHAAIARQIVAEAPNADVIVLAQASMAPAAELAGGVAIEVLSSPRLGVQHAVRCLHAGRG